MLSVDMKRVTPFLLITFAFLNVIVGVNVTNTTDSDFQKMEVQIYYEALCPDSIRFIRHKLYDATITKKLLKYTDLKFIPYGKVSKWIDPATKEVNLNCQHGLRECENNAFQACIVEHNTQFEQMQMIDCLLGKFTPNQCSEMLNINITAAIECRRTRKIADILKTYGEQTDAIDIWFVPSIGIDGKFEENIQSRILSQYLSVFCSKYKGKYNVLPPNCSV